MRSAPSTQAAASGPVRLGAVAAIAGGAAWLLKGTAILLTGDQPPGAFAIGPPLFAVGLLGLSAAVDRRDRLTKAGAAAAALALLWMVAFAIADAVDPSLAPRGEEFTVLSAVQLAAALCLLAALVLLGLAGRRADAGAWTALPFWMGLLVVPGLLAGGALSLVDERLLEIPLVLFAIAWVWLGYAMWHATAPHATST